MDSFDKTLRQVLACVSAAELIKRQGTPVAINNAVEMGFKIADSALSLDERADLNQAILSLQDDIARCDHKLLHTMPDNDRRWYVQRKASCERALEILRRFNLPNPPTA